MYILPKQTTSKQVEQMKLSGTFTVCYGDEAEDPAQGPLKRGDHLPWHSDVGRCTLAMHSMVETAVEVRLYVQLPSGHLTLMEKLTINNDWKF